MKYIRLQLTIFILTFSGIIYANNLKITNTTRPAADEIEFDIEWENSWYLNFAPNNWDAVWVFIKAQDCNTDKKAWEHVDVSTSSGDHSTSSPLQVEAVTDGKGVFIRRQSVGSGNISTTSVKLKLQNAYSLSNVNFEVLGIEMVSVQEGAFEIGGISMSGSSTSSTSASHSFRNATISSESQINSGDIKSNGLSTSSSAQSAQGYNPDIPASFPKGYNKFYIMKYEITQEQYVRFLNLLSFSQQGNRTENAPGLPSNSNALSTSVTGIVNRSAVKIKTTGTINSPTVYACNYNDNSTFDELDDGQNIACNFLNWKDLLAYLDWAALRPMTELEYEKACRGFDAVFADEYAWGNANITAARSNALSNAGAGNEVTTTVLESNSGMAAISPSSAISSHGPLRVGFAATQSSIRKSAGASYWGVLDLTGNVWEQTISAGYGNGNISAFTGTLGDGEIDEFGDADQTGWSLDPLHCVVRGGSWFSRTSTSSTSYTYSYGKVGSRYFVGTTDYTLNRNQETGGRGVRQF